MTTTHATSTAITDACRALRGLWPLLLTSIGSTSHGGTPSSDSVTALDRRVDLSRQITLTLNGWARGIVDGRDLTTDLPAGNDLPGLARLLERHADWLSGQPGGPACADQLLEHARELRATLAPKRRDWVHLGTCPLLRWDDEAQQAVTCAGRVRARVGSADGEATCETCKTSRSIAWWQWELGLTKPPLTGEAMARVLHDRMGVTVTGQTVRNWAKQGLIDVYVEPFGPAPRWPRFDQEAVMLQVAQMGRACQMCGHAWHGSGDLCTRCYVQVHSQRPRRSQPKRHTPVLGARRAYRPDPVVVRIPEEELVRRDWCVFGDLPTVWCGCGRHVESAMVG